MSVCAGFNTFSVNWPYLLYKYISRESRVENGRHSLSRMMMQMRMAMMAPVPRPAAMMSCWSVQSPCMSHWHTLMRRYDVLDMGR